MRLLPRAALVHEALEFLAILGVADVVEEFGEFARGVFELAPLGFEPGELGRLPLVERDVAGRRRRRQPFHAA